MNGKIILLNGPSSAGKTTIAKAIQQTIDEPFWHGGAEPGTFGHLHPRGVGALPAVVFGAVPEDGLVADATGGGWGATVVLLRECRQAGER